MLQLLFYLIKEKVKETMQDYFVIGNIIDQESIIKVLRVNKINEILKNEFQVFNKYLNSEEKEIINRILKDVKEFCERYEETLEAILSINMIDDYRKSVINDPVIIGKTQISQMKIESVQKFEQNGDFPQHTYPYEFKKFIQDMKNKIKENLELIFSIEENGYSIEKILKEIKSNTNLEKLKEIAIGL
mgnify:CR=1 FL=1